MPHKRQLIDSLPISAGEFTIRKWTRADLDERATWPLYPAPYEGFNSSWPQTSPAQRDERFALGEANPTGLTLIADHLSQPCVVYVVLMEIDWETGAAGNMGLRVRPDWCDKGVGTLVMRAIAGWWFDQGMISLCHDVCAANPRAVRCYEKIGYVVTGEFWHDDPNAGVLPDDLQQHVRLDGPVPQLRFYWMELAAERRG